MLLLSRDSAPAEAGDLWQGIGAAVQQLEASLQSIYVDGISRRWLALRLLEGDPSVVEAIRQYNLAEGEGGPWE